MDGIQLSCGDKHGCFTILRVSEGKQEPKKRVYDCQCDCGKIYESVAEFYLKKKKRYCFDECGLRIAHNERMKDSYPRKKHESYDVPYLNTMNGTLEIIECIDEHYEGTAEVWGRKKGQGRILVYKKYKCHCVVCNHEEEYLSSDFEIRLVSQGGRKKYVSKAICEYCKKYKGYEPSSFEWRTEKIFRENKIKYKREESFADLYGNWGVYQLRFDFAIYDSEGKLRGLVECQGEQHIKPCEDFGGKKSFEMQVQNDNGKRMYAKQKGIPLIEIPDTCNTLEKEKQFLMKAGIIPNIRNE